VAPSLRRVPQTVSFFHCGKDSNRAPGTGKRGTSVRASADDEANARSGSDMQVIVTD